MKSWLVQVDARISAVEESQATAQQLTHQALDRVRADVDASLAKLHTDMDASLAREVAQIEFSCNAAMGEMTSAGIEQLSASTATAGARAPSRFGTYQLGKNRTAELTECAGQNVAVMRPSIRMP